MKAYVINKTEDGYFLSDGNGFAIEGEELFEIGINLLRFAKKHEKDLELHNIQRRAEIEQELREWESKSNVPKPKTKAHVYIMKCGEYYKIGFSKDVERRARELDRRPYKVNVIYISPATEYAYEIEQGLHEWLEEYRVSGEWYDLPQDMIEAICNEIVYEIDFNTTFGG